MVFVVLSSYGIQISGASAGASIALSALIDMSLGRCRCKPLPRCHETRASAEDMVRNTMEGCRRARRGALGPLSPSFDPGTWISEIHDRILTEDTAREVSSRAVHEINCLNTCLECFA